MWQCLCRLETYDCLFWSCSKWKVSKYILHLVILKLLWESFSLGKHILPSIWYIAHPLQSDPINSDLCFRFSDFLVPRLSLRYSLSSLSCRVKKIIILRSFAKLSLVFILPSLFPPTVPCIWISCFHCFACTPTSRYLLSYHLFFFLDFMFLSLSIYFWRHCCLK